MMLVYVDRYGAFGHGVLIAAFMMAFEMILHECQSWEKTAKLSGSPPNQLGRSILSEFVWFNDLIIIYPLFGLLL